MEHDLRRNRGQWKGCHSFGNGGLKMGETYYYFYELDGSTETHDPSLPSTTACPSLPGQPVNTLYVPFEMSTRKRSASLSSVRDCDFMTVKAEDKFVAPRAAPPVPELPACRRATSHIRSLAHKRSTRSLSPNPQWSSWSPRRLFSRSKSSQSQKESEKGNGDADDQLPSALMDDQRSVRSTSAQSSRSRDISPDSLLRFLSEDSPLPLAESAVEEDSNGPYLSIPEDIAEENDDDENFATSAQSECAPVTVLSPPPSQRSFPSSSTLARLAKDSRPQTPAAPTRAAPTLPILHQITANLPQSRFSAGSSIAPLSPESTASHETPSFYFSDDEEDDEEEEEEGAFTLMPLQGINTSFDSSFSTLISTFAGYTLPEAAVSENKMAPASAGSPAAAREHASAAGASPLSVARIAETNDLIDELRWMAPAVVRA